MQTCGTNPPSAKLSRTVLAEVDERFIRTYGDNYIHVSEIDAFVENTPPPMYDEEMNEIISAIQDPARRQELTDIASKLEFERRRDFIPQIADLDLAQMRHVGFLVRRGIRPGARR